MRAIFTSGSVGGAPGNRRIYPEADQVPRRRFRRVKRSAGGTWPLSLALLRHEVARFTSGHYRT